MSAIHLNRLRSPLLAAGAVALALAALDLLLAASFGFHPRWLPPRIFAGGLQPIGSRIARVEQLQAAGRVTDGKLVAVVGTSTVQQGLDPRTLSDNDPLHRKWLVVAEGGDSFREVEIYGRVLLDSSLRPRWVVLGLQTSMLHSEDDWYHAGSAAASIGHLLHGHLAATLTDCSWLARNRDSLHDSTTILDYHAARWVRCAAHLPMAAQFVPEDDPWSIIARHPTLHTHPALTAMMKATSTRQLSRSEFLDNSRQMDALGRLVAAFRAHGADVIGVLMPEPSELRALHPAFVQRRFQQALAAIAQTGDPLPVIDLQASMSDNLFYDFVHLNEPGRMRLSSELPKLLP